MCPKLNSNTITIVVVEVSDNIKPKLLPVGTLLDFSYSFVQISILNLPR